MTPCRKVSVFLACSGMFAIILAAPIIPSPGTDTTDVPPETEETHLVKLSSELEGEGGAPIAIPPTVRAQELELTTASETVTEAVAPLTTAAALAHTSKTMLLSEDTNLVPVTRAIDIEDAVHESGATEVPGVTTAVETAAPVATTATPLELPSEITGEETTVLPLTIAPELASNALRNETSAIINAESNITKNIISAESNITNSIISTVSNITNKIISPASNLTNKLESRINIGAVSETTTTAVQTTKTSSVASITETIKAARPLATTAAPLELPSETILEETTNLPATIATQLPANTLQNETSNIISIENITNNIIKTEYNVTNRIINTLSNITYNITTAVRNLTNEFESSITTEGGALEATTTAVPTTTAPLELPSETSGGKTTSLPVTKASLLNALLNETNRIIKAENNISNNVINSINNVTNNVISAERNFTHHKISTISYTTNNISSAVSTLSNELELGEANTTAVPTTNLSGKTTTTQTTEAAVPITTTKSHPQQTSKTTEEETTILPVTKTPGEANTTAVPTTNPSGKTTTTQTTEAAVPITTTKSHPQQTSKTTEEETTILPVTKTPGEANTTAVPTTNPSGKTTTTQTTEAAVPITTTKSHPQQTSKTTEEETTILPVTKTPGESNTTAVPTTNPSGKTTTTQTTEAAVPITTTKSHPQQTSKTTEEETTILPVTKTPGEANTTAVPTTNPSGKTTTTQKTEAAVPITTTKSHPQQTSKTTEEETTILPVTKTPGEANTTAVPTTNPSGKTTTTQTTEAAVPITTTKSHPQQTSKTIEKETTILPVTKTPGEANTTAVPTTNPSGKTTTTQTTEAAVPITTTKSHPQQTSKTTEEETTILPVTKTPGEANTTAVPTTNPSGKTTTTQTTEAAVPITTTKSHPQQTSKTTEEGTTILPVTKTPGEANTTAVPTTNPSGKTTTTQTTEAAVPITTTKSHPQQTSKTTEEETTILPVTKTPVFDLKALQNKTNKIIRAETNITKSIINSINNATNDIISAERNFSNSIISTINNITNNIVKNVNNFTYDFKSSINNSFSEKQEVNGAERNFSNSIISTINNITNNIVKNVNNFTYDFKSSINNSVSEKQEVNGVSSQFSSVFAQSLALNNSQNQFSGLFSQSLHVGKTPKFFNRRRGIPGAARPKEGSRFWQGRNMASNSMPEVHRNRRVVYVPSHETEISDTHDKADESIEIVEATAAPQGTSEVNAAKDVADAVHEVTTARVPTTEASDFLATDAEAIEGAAPLATTAGSLELPSETTGDGTTILPVTIAQLHDSNAHSNETSNINSAKSNITDKIISAEKNITNGVINVISNITNKVIGVESNLTNNVISTISNITSNILSTANNLTNQFKASINISISDSQKVNNFSSKFRSSGSLQVNSSQGQISENFFQRLVAVDESPKVASIGAGTLGAARFRRALAYSQSRKMASILFNHLKRNRRTAGVPRSTQIGTGISKTHDTTEESADATEANPAHQETTRANAALTAESDTGGALRKATTTAVPTTETSGVTNATKTIEVAVPVATTAAPLDLPSEIAGEETTILPVTIAPLQDSNAVLNQTSDIIKAEGNITNHIISAETNITNGVINVISNVTNNVVSAESNLTNKVISTISNITNNVVSTANNRTNQFVTSIDNSISESQKVNSVSSKVKSSLSESLRVDSSQGQISGIFSQTLQVDKSPKATHSEAGIPEVARSKRASGFLQRGNEESIFNNQAERNRRAADVNMTTPNGTKTSDTNETKDESIEDLDLTGFTMETAIYAETETAAPELTTEELSTTAVGITTASLRTEVPSSEKTTKETTILRITTTPPSAVNRIRNQTNDLIKAESNLTNSIINAGNNITNGIISAENNLTNSIVSAISNITNKIKMSINTSISDFLQFTNDSQSQIGSVFSQTLNVNSSLKSPLFQSPKDDNSQSRFNSLFSQSQKANSSQNQFNGLFSQSLKVDNSQSQFNSLFSQSQKANSSQNQFNGLFSQSLKNKNAPSQFSSLFSKIQKTNNSQDRYNGLFSQSLGIGNSRSQFGSLFSQNLKANGSQSQLSRLFSESLNVDTSQGQFGSFFSQNLKLNDSQSKFSSLFSQALKEFQSQRANPISQGLAGDVGNCVSTPENPDCQNRDGEWGPWTSFSECSPLCEQSRHRACDSPKPLGNGIMCHGEFLEKRSCDVDKCRPAPPLSDDMGCYRIGHKYYHSSDANNTRTQCSHECAQNDKLYSGVHGVKCFCSNVAVDGNDLYKVNDTLCTSPCPGNSSETCGGEDGEDSVSSFERTDTNYVGCYEVTDYTREFASQLPDSIKDKSHHCAIACSGRRFRYSMANKTHCVCVNNLYAAAKKTAESDCDEEDKNNTKSNDSTSMKDRSGLLAGGGANGAKRVKRTNFELHSATSGTDLGCYKATHLHKQILIDTKNSERVVNNCVRACEDRGFPLAAVQGPQPGKFVCQCDRGITHDAENASHCDSFCGKHRCGSDNFESYFSAKCGEAFRLGSSIMPFNTNASNDLYNRTGSKITWVTSFYAPRKALPSSLGDPLDVNRTALSFQVDLNTPRLVRQLQFSGHPRKPVGVTRFAMTVTVDGSVWSFVKVPGTNSFQIFSESSDIVGRNHITKFDFTHLIAVKSARVYVLDFKTFPAFRIDFIGCNADI